MYQGTVTGRVRNDATSTEISRVKEEGSAIVTGAVFVVSPNGATMCYIPKGAQTISNGNRLEVKENGATYNDNTLLDESMALTTEEINAICV